MPPIGINRTCFQREMCYLQIYISNSKINFLMWTGYVNFKTVNLRF